MRTELELEGEMKRLCGAWLLYDVFDVFLARWKHNMCKFTDSTMRFIESISLFCCNPSSNVLDYKKGV